MRRYQRIYTALKKNNIDVNVVATDFGYDVDWEFPNNLNLEDNNCYGYHNVIVESDNSLSEGQREYLEREMKRYCN